MSKLAEEIRAALEQLAFKGELKGSIKEIYQEECALIDEKLSEVLRLVAQMSLSGKAVDSLYESLKVEEED